MFLALAQCSLQDTCYLWVAEKASRNPSHHAALGPSAGPAELPLQPIFITLTSKDLMGLFLQP